MYKSGKNHGGMNESVTCSDLIDARFKWEDYAKSVYITIVRVHFFRSRFPDVIAEF